MRKTGANALFAAAIVVAEFASVGVLATPASASDTLQDRRQIKRQQQLILEQQRQILANQRRLDAQKGQIERSPVTGEAIDRRALPKGLLSGILPDCPLGFAYSPFVGCVLYVAH